MLASDEQSEPDASAGENQLAAFNRTTKQTRYRIQDTYPGSLLYERENILYCILPLDKDITGGGLNAWLNELVRQGEGEQHIRMFAGVRNICYDNLHYHSRYYAPLGSFHIAHCLALHSPSHSCIAPSRDHDVE